MWAIVAGLLVSGIATDFSGCVIKVIVTGTLDGDSIKIETIKVDSGCIPGPTGCK